MYHSDTQASAPGNPARDALLRRVLSPSPVFTLHDRNDDERKAVEAFVAARFRKDYGADLHEFMPTLLSMRCLNSFSGAIGMRKAGTSPLFLEQYLDTDIDEVMSRATGSGIERHDIVEIGNLVAGRKGPSQFVFLVATSLLHTAGYRWITFTATQTLANNLNKLGFPTLFLAQASPHCLPGSTAQDWGSYYHTRPRVYAGSLDAAMAIARKRPLFRKVMALYRREINDLAAIVSGSGT